MAAHNLPCYVAGRDEPQTLDSYIEPMNLMQGAVPVLQHVLKMHAGIVDESIDEYSSQLAPANQGDRHTSESYAFELAKACARALTVNQKQAVAQIPASHIATLVLSIVAGRILASRKKQNGGFSVHNTPISVQGQFFIQLAHLVNNICQMSEATLGRLWFMLRGAQPLPLLGSQ